MTQEQENYLRMVYPKIFPDGTNDVYCGDGWFNIVRMLCRDIQAYLDWKPQVKQVTVAQMKEKFGTLRFYYDGGDEYIRGLVSMAESLSEVTCEECGKPGELRQGGWLKTLCDEHHEQREARKRNAD
jgi:hypothetical protein